MSSHCARPKLQRHIHWAALQLIYPKQNITPAIADCRYRVPLTPRLARKSIAIFFFILYIMIKRRKIVTNFANVFSLYTVPFFMSSMHLFFFLSLSQLPKKVFHHDPAFFFQYTCYFFYLMIKPLFFQYI